MTLRTRLTEQLGLSLPIISAPMAFAAGAELATAVSACGGLGLIGGGYGDPGWAGEQFKAAGNHAVGCGFITWAITNDPRALDVALSYRPRAIMLSFGDPAPHAVAIKGAGALLICQIQSRRDAEHALDCGADIIVAQGAEAGGHGEKRATFTLVGWRYCRRSRACCRTHARRRWRTCRFKALGEQRGQRFPQHARRSARRHG